ncbi:Voltage gated chloride channel CBS domain [Trypanosoma vivax]|nr:putative chloride channel protein [Trypanosoma vivax]KAH8604125.1 Voltage gated chloride channel CBS domain [Trypanosoma vivax]
MLRSLANDFIATANPYRTYVDEDGEKVLQQARFESFDYHKPYPSMYMEHLRELYSGKAAVSSAACASPSVENGACEVQVVPTASPVERSPDSRERLQCFDGKRTNSLNLSDVVNRYDRNERSEPLRWLMHVVVAVCVGIIAILISYSVEMLEDYRGNTLEHVIAKRSFVSYAFASLFYMFFSIALVAVAAGVVVFFEPAAAGSGIPDVMAHLNGVHVKKTTNIRIFIAKSISCVFAVAGGLPLGLEAPLIHLGAIVGAGITQGQSRTLGFQTSFLQAFRNNKDRRDFMTAGAACGVSAAFGAPIGGLLFVIEEVSSFWDHSASVQIFLSTMLCFTTVSIFRSLTEDQRLLGWVSNAISVLFEVNLTIPLHLGSIVPSIFLGISCGVFAAVFTKVSVMLIRYRRDPTRQSKLRRFVEPLIVVSLFGALSLSVALVSSCHVTKEVNRSNDMLIWGTENSSALFTATCTVPDTYSPLGTLTMGTGKEVIRHLFTRQTIGQFSVLHILVFLLLYTCFTCLSSGLAVSGGVVVPSLVIGAAFGRLFGQFVCFLAMHQSVMERGYSVSHAWMDPGLFALIGAGAFFSGVSRMTISICVIMVELSSETHYLLPIMVSIILSKVVADAVSEPLYHQILQLDAVPYLKAHLLEPEFEQLTAADVMASNVVTLRLREKTSVVLQAIRRTTHHAFPVVQAVHGAEPLQDPANTVHDEESRDVGRWIPQVTNKEQVQYKFVGLVTREDLQIYLSLPQLARHQSTCDASSGCDDGFGGGLAPGVVAVGKMTWREWLVHKTSLFFVIGSKRWFEMWANTDDRDNELMPVNPSAAGTGRGGADVFQIDEQGLPTVIDLSLIVNSSPWVIPPLFNLKMAYHTFRMLGVRHMTVVDGDRVVGIITRKDLLIGALRRRLKQLRDRIAASGNQAEGSF